MRIGFDMDGTLYNFVARIAEWMKLHTDVDIPPIINPTNWHFYLDWGIDAEQFWTHVDAAVDAQFLYFYGEMLEPNVHEELGRLTSTGHDLVYVTCRGTERRIKNATEHWLELHGLPEGDVIVLPQSDTKIGTCDILLDDSPFIVEAWKTKNRDVFIYDQPWNRHVEHDLRAYCVKDYVDFIVGNDYDYET